MSLHVNLILEHERRSGSLINLRSIIRVTIIVLPVLFATAIAWGAWSTKSAKNNLVEKTATYESLVKKETAYTELKKSDNSLKLYLTDIERFNKSRIDWHIHLLAIRDALPKNIHVKSMIMQSKIVAMDPINRLKYARSYTLVIKGITSGTVSDFEKIRQTLQTAPVFTNDVQSAAISDFESVSGDLSNFELSIGYKAKILR